MTFPTQFPTHPPAQIQEQEQKVLGSWLESEKDSFQADAHQQTWEQISNDATSTTMCNHSVANMDTKFCPLNVTLAPTPPSCPHLRLMSALSFRAIPLARLDPNPIASSGCSWARLDPNTCQRECQTECQSGGITERKHFFKSPIKTYQHPSSHVPSHVPCHVCLREEGACRLFLLPKLRNWRATHDLNGASCPGWCSAAAKVVWVGCEWWVLVMKGLIQ